MGITDMGYQYLLQQWLDNILISACFSVLPEKKSTSPSSKPLGPEATLSFKQESVHLSETTQQSLLLLGRCNFSQLYQCLEKDQNQRC